MFIFKLTKKSLFVNFVFAKDMVDMDEKAGSVVYAGPERVPLLKTGAEVEGKHSDCCSWQ